MQWGWGGWRVFKASRRDIRRRGLEKQGKKGLKLGITSDGERQTRYVGVKKQQRGKNRKGRER